MSTLTGPTVDELYLLADGPLVTLDLETSNSFQLTLGGNRTLNLINDRAGVGQSKLFSLVLIQDDSGSRLVTWFPNIRWQGGTVPTLTTTAGAADLFIFYKIGSSYFGTSLLNF